MDNTPIKEEDSWTENELRQMSDELTPYTVGKWVRKSDLIGQTKRGRIKGILQRKAFGRIMPVLQIQFDGDYSTSMITIPKELFNSILEKLGTDKKLWNNQVISLRGEPFESDINGELVTGATLKLV